MRRLGALLLVAGGVWSAPAEAQRTEENAARDAEDGFGTSVGNESIGIYASGEVRGFSATAAGNNRIEGLYFDRAGEVTDVIVRGSTVRVGLTAFGHPFPAPTGIVDLELRRAGPEPVVSVQIDSGDYLGSDVTVDAALPVTDRFGINLDFGLYDDQYASGASAWFVSYGGVARWRPVDPVELTGFFGRYDYGDEEQSPVLYPAGAHLPPRVERRRFYGQEWADWAGHSQNYGGTAKATLGSWQLAAGAFGSRFTRDSYASAYFTDVGADGMGRSFLLSGRDQRAASVSGELRISRALDDGPRRHWLLASVRGRQVDTDYGGYALADFGPAQIGVPAPLPRPDFAYGPLTHDRVRQVSYAAGYEMRWPGVAEINLGVTRSDYRKSIVQPGLPEAAQRDRPWLWNGSLAVTPTRRLTLYAAATRGLEESGVAPANAANRGAALPALRTRQQEVGLRYAFSDDWRLVVVGFDIAKPYFEIDRTDGVYRELGTVNHRGIEASLSARPVENLSVVAGAVMLRPRVTGQAVEDGRLGERPIGRTGLLIDAAADYRIASVPGLSIDARVTHEGRRTANAEGTLELPAHRRGRAAHARSNRAERCADCHAARDLFPFGQAQRPSRPAPRCRPNAAMRPQVREDRRGCLAEHPPDQLQPLATLPAIPDLRALSRREEAPLSLLAHLPPHLSIKVKCCDDRLNPRWKADFVATGHGVQVLASQPDRSTSLQYSGTSQLRLSCYP